MLPQNPILVDMILNSKSDITGGGQATWAIMFPLFFQKVNLKSIF